MPCLVKYSGHFYYLYNMIGIYKITNPCGNIYIGQSKDIYKRIASYKKNDCKKQIKIHRSIVKYGFKAHRFDILEECSLSDLCEREIFYINLYNSTDRDTGLNLKGGGINGALCVESIEKMRKSLQDRAKAPDVINKYSIMGKIAAEKTAGKKRTPEVLAKIRATKIARGNLGISQETREKINAVIRESFKNNPEKKARLLEMRKLGTGNNKKVLCTVTGKIWDSATELAIERGLNVRYLRKQLAGSRTNFTSYAYISK